jgi:hypothetical protein
VAVEYNTDGSISSAIEAYKPESGSTEAASVAVVCKADGTKYATAPTPPANDDSDKIATTEWVKDIADNLKMNDYLPLTGGTMQGDIYYKDDTSCLTVAGYPNEDSKYGATIQLNGALRQEDPGRAIIKAQDWQGNNTKLTVRPDGQVYVSVQGEFEHLVRSVNGTKADANGNVEIKVSGTTGVTSVNGKTGAVTLTIPPTPNCYVTASSNNGNSGYRKWNNGTIENWVTVSCDKDTQVTANFSLAFAGGFVAFATYFSESNTSVGDRDCELTYCNKAYVKANAHGAGHIYIYAIGK